MSLWGIAKSGDVLGFVKKLWSLAFGHDMPDDLAKFVAKFATDEGRLVWDTATTFISDVPTKGVKQAAVDGWATIAIQAPSLALKDFEDALGIQSRA
jgi:hypothetical protein